MENKINIKINDFGPINKADIDLNKINVVGGNNATGKSTTSKLLYCFLKSNMDDRIDFALEHSRLQIDSLINNIYLALHVNQPEFVYLKDVREFGMSDNNDKVIPFNELRVEEKFHQIQIDYNRYYDENNDNERIKGMIKEIDDILTTIHIEEDKLTILLLKDFLSSEFNRKNLKFNSAFNGIVNGDEFDININLKDNDFDSDNAFSANGYFNSEDVIYIDTFSFFETHAPWRTDYHHAGYITKVLMFDNQEDLEEITDERLLKVIEKIKEIINGKITFVNNKFTFIQDKTTEVDSLAITDAASGIKQIAIIQLLLANGELKPNSFLIFDEPEVNLHPDWQFKFAEILVLLAKELNITIYLNSHSPLFIEAMDVFSETYDFEDSINYYLTEESEIPGKYNFTKIESNELYKVYDNLGNVYKLVDQLRLKEDLNRLC
ncbi:AAA family ATPase [Methanobrevibacter sp. V14]|uniref:AAA family ATPase n=1 Tax=Methanobrevibacter sp. V14 TaxID=3064280 RepID=UPI00273634C5|nr:AAA family ATPase [Methanobrevibacter sp. V14]